MAKQDIEDLIRSRPPLFWWLLANVLAITFAITSWVICLNLFRDPTHPTSYKLMHQVGRVPILKAYNLTTAPRPKKTNNPLELEADFQRFKGDDRKALNQELLRAYLTNFKKPKFLTYVTGDFKIMEARALNESDFLPQGVVVKTQAVIQSKKNEDFIAYPIFAEFLFPSENASKEDFLPGSILTIRQRSKKQKPDCAAVLHLSSIDYDGNRALSFTLIPIRSGERSTPAGTTITIAPPEAANLTQSPFPVY